MNKSDKTLQLIPDFILNIGITGHRKLDAANISEYEKTIIDILECIKHLCLEINKMGKEVFSLKEPTYKLITPLAEGADRIAAKAAIKCGFQLQAVLPLEKSQYEKDFPETDSVVEFNALLNKATSVYEINLNKINNNKAYLEAGKVVLAHSDILIAIWDGVENGGIGGTSDIVSRAVSMNLPVVLINSNMCNDIKIYNENNSGQDWKSYVEKYLNNILIPEGSENIFPSVFNEKAKDNWFNQFEKHLLEIITKLNKKSVSPKLKDLSSAAINDEITDQIFSPYYYHLDSLAITYAGYYRSAGAFRQLFPLFAVISLAIGFYWGLSNNTGLINVIGFSMQVLFLGLIIYLSHMNRIKRWHAKFTDYRLLAEYLRYMTFLYPFGGTLEYAKELVFVPGKKSNWINWYYRAIVRQAGIPNEKFNEILFLKNKKSLENLVNEQICYHSYNINKHNSLVGFFERNGLLLYNIGLIVTTLRVIVQYLKIPYGKLLSSMELPIFFNMLSMIIPAVATSLFGIAAQGNYQRLEQRSRAMVELLTIQKNKIKEMREISYSSLKASAEELSNIFISEILDWNVLIKSKGISKN